MNKPSEESFTRDNDIYSSSEAVRLVGNKTPVQHDDKTVQDDLSDYVFLKPTKSKRGRPGSAGRHKSRRRKKKMRTWKKVLLSILCTILALVLITVGTGVALMFKGQSELYDPNINIISPDGIEAQIQNDGKYIVYNGATYQYNENITSMLFLGVDKRDMEDLGDYGAGGQADVIVVMAIDTKSGKTVMMNLPRDTMTDVAVYSVGGNYTGMKTQQVCLAYAYGDGKETSCNNTLASVRRIFYNVPIKSYFALDMDGIAAMNDSVGGVDVVSPETVGNFVEGQQYHLDGEQAESFVRTRTHERADANLLRMQRQQIYAAAYMNKVVTATKQDITTPVSMFNASAPYSCTNLNASKIAYLAKEIVINKGMSFDMLTVSGETSLNENEYAEFHINEKEFFEQFLSVYYEKM